MTKRTVVLKQCGVPAQVFITSTVEAARKKTIAPGDVHFLFTVKFIVLVEQFSWVLNYDEI